MDPFDMDTASASETEKPDDVVKKRLEQPLGAFSAGPASIEGVRTLDGTLTCFKVSFKGRVYQLFANQEFVQFEGEYAYEKRPSPQIDKLVDMAVGENDRWWHVYRTRYGGAMFEPSIGYACEINPWWASGLEKWIRDEDVEVINPDHPGVKK